MLRIYLPSSTDLKLCSDVPTVDFINKWTFVTYLHPGTWVLTSGSLQLWDESARMKVQRWKCEDESVRMKVWGWKCEDESARMKMGGWKCEDESAGMKSARMKVRGWKCEDESARMKMLRMKNPRMKKPEDEKPRMKVKGWNIRGWSVTQPKKMYVVNHSLLLEMVQQNNSSTSLPT